MRGIHPRRDRKPERHQLRLRHYSTKRPAGKEGAIPESILPRLPLMLRPFVPIYKITQARGNEP